MISFEIKSLMLRCVAGFANFVCRNFIHGGSSSGVFPCFIYKKMLEQIIAVLDYAYKKAFSGLNTYTSDLVHFRGYVVPVHVPNKTSQSCHAFMLIKLIEFKVHNCILRMIHLLCCFLE